MCRPERVVLSRERLARTLAVPARCQMRTAAPRGCLLGACQGQTQGQQPQEEVLGMAHSALTDSLPLWPNPMRWVTSSPFTPQEIEGSREKGQFPKHRPRLRAGQHQTLCPKREHAPVGTSALSGHSSSPLLFQTRSWQVGPRPCRGLRVPWARWLRWGTVTRSPTCPLKHISSYLSPTTFWGDTQSSPGPP